MTARTIVDAPKTEPRHLAQPYDEGLDDKWDHIIGPEIARADEQRRSRKPARHRGYGPAIEYFDAVRRMTTPDSKLMRAVDQAQSRTETRPSIVAL